MGCLSDNIIDYSEYFNHPVELRRYNESESEYSPDGEYGEPETIFCWIGGAEKFHRGNEEQLTVASKTYRTLTPLKAKDMIDGQVILDAYTKYGLDGVTVEYYKAFVE